MQKLMPLCHGTIESLTTADDESISLTRRRLAPREAPADISSTLLPVRNYSRYIRALYRDGNCWRTLHAVGLGDLKFSCVNSYEFSSTLRAGDRSVLSAFSRLVRTRQRDKYSSSSRVYVYAVGPRAEIALSLHARVSEHGSLRIH